LVVVVHLDRERALAGWRREAGVIAGAVGAIVVAAVVLALAFYRRLVRAAAQRAVAVAALAANEDRFRKLASLSSDWYWEQDAEYRFTRLSGDLVGHTGLSINTLLGKTRWELPSIGVTDAVWAQHRATRDARRPFRDLVLGRADRDGRAHWIAVSGDPVFGDDATFRGYWGVGSEITERREAEDALRELNDRLLALIEAIPDAIIFKDGGGRWLVANQRAQRLFRLQDVAWQGMTDRELATAQPEFRSAYDAALVDDEKAWAAAAMTLFEQSIADERGEHRQFDVRKVPLYETGGGRKALVVVATDVTERKQAERLLRDSVALNVSVLNALSEHIAVLDRNGVIVAVNTAWRRFATDHGASATLVESTGLDYRNICLSAARLPGGEDAAAAWTGIAGVLAGEQGKFSFEYPCAAPEGELWFRMTAYPLAVSGGGAVVAHLDITERKRADEFIRVAAKVFEAQEGMVITDAATVIQEVNHAFTEITGYEAAEIVGRTPRVLKSDRHDAAFFTAMWDCIRRDGAWKGEIWNRRRNGEISPQWLTITAVHGEAGTITHYVGTFTDITQRKAAEAEIEYLAFFDPLSQLPNRRLLLDRLQHALSASARGGRQGALLFIDLDNFKTLNDSRGHDVGDLLLQQMARELLSCVREGDTVARLGGDEYVVMLEGLGATASGAAQLAETIARKILAAIAEPMQIAGQEHHSSASIGIALFSDVGATVDELLKRADLAMYRAKAAGRNTLRFFDPVMQAAVAARAALEADMRRGVRERQFELAYQPQVDRSGRLVGAEALLRWRHPSRGAVEPAEFIGSAEESGLIVALGQWVLEAACTELATWGDQPGAAGVALAVNVSAREFHHPDFVRNALAVLERTGANPRRLMLEFTESLLLGDTADTVRKMTALRERGIRFSLDDFGTGYSSLAYLKHLPLDQLKIDRSFVHDLFTDPSDATIAQAIVALGRSLGLTVMAEGVETPRQREFLARLGCDGFQGYLFGRPGPAAMLWRVAGGGDPPAPG
jgi:diguanylate cyclase (GGDEF)-like protein/PAS domain S-box-containing protein